MASDLERIYSRTVEAYEEFGGLIKHVVRYKIWLPEAQSLMEEKKRYLKYFTLPGKWAWDILFFEQNGVIQRVGRGFPEVRFCDSNAKSYSTAKTLLGSTVGKKENFEDLVLNESAEFWDGFPYDLYNLDFTGTLFPYDQPPFSKTFQAIQKIIETHVSKSQFSFVIFLTNKAMESETRQSAKQELEENIERNRNNPELVDLLNERIPNTDRLVRDNFANFILVSISKLICDISRSKCDLQLKTRAKYERGNARDGGYFMTNFVFKFSKAQTSSASVSNNNFVESVKDAIKLDNVLLIGPSSITQNVRSSHRELKNYRNSLISG